MAFDKNEIDSDIWDIFSQLFYGCKEIEVFSVVLYCILCIFGFGNRVDSSKTITSYRDPPEGDVVSMAKIYYVA